MESFRSINRVELLGRLGADPEMRYTPQGTAVTTIRVATGEKYTKSDGSERDTTEWHSVVIWDKTAEVVNQYATKGSRVYISGRLQTRSWDDTETGQKRYKTEVVAENVILLDSKTGGDGEQAEPSPKNSRSAPDPSRAAPRPKGSARSAPTRNVPQAIEDDEDLPF